MNKPLISIITPCYNSEKYLGRYFDYILKQTYKNIQIIIVNDGSTDGTEKAIYSYQKQLEDMGIVFTYIFQENKGLGGAINTGLKAIKGEYFTWCDSDNFYNDQYVEKCVQFINAHPDCNILRCDGYVVSEDDLTKPIRRFSDGNTEKYKKDLFDNAIFEKNFHFGCALLKTAAFDIINPNREIYESRQGQNWQLLLPMFYKYDANYIDDPLFYFVYRKDSISNIASSQDIKQKIAQLDEYEKILNESIKDLDIDIERYMNLIDIKYLKRKFNVAFIYGDRFHLKEYFSRLQKYHCLSFEDRLKYQIWTHKKIFTLVRWSYRTMSKIKRGVKNNNYK